MTALSSLIGAFAGVPYASDVPVYLAVLNNTGNTDYAINQDHLLPFIPRADVTIDAVWWHRLSATVANVYVGIYDATGNLLTDCAVDADTTVGLHSVATTAVTLDAGQIYYLALNQSAAVVASDTVATADAEFSTQIAMRLPASDSRMSTTTPTSIRMAGGFDKARTAAALPATQTMTGWGYTSEVMLGGFVPV
jgi:hypothetical protein